MKGHAMMSIIKHFSNLFGGDQVFQWEKRTIKVEHVSGETKALCSKA